MLSIGAGNVGKESEFFVAPAKQPFQHGSLENLLLDHCTLIIQQVVKGDGREKNKGRDGFSMKPLPSESIKGERGKELVRTAWPVFAPSFSPFGSIK